MGGFICTLYSFSAQCRGVRGEYTELKCPDFLGYYDCSSLYGKISPMTGEVKQNLLVNAVAMGLVTGWSAERLLAVSTDRLFPNDSRKSAIAELTVISLVDTILLLSTMSLAFNSDPQLSTVFVSLLGSFGLSLSGFGYSRCAGQINPST